MESPPNIPPANLPPDDADPMEKLTEKQRKFVLSYVECGNGARAARDAGYAEPSARIEAWKQLRNPLIKAALNHFAEENAMSAGEAIGRMSNWGRGSLHPFLTSTGEIDLLTDAAQESLGQIKKYKHRKTVTRGPNDYVTETTTTEIELYDAKDAVDKMIQLYGRYKQLPGANGGPTQLLIELGDNITLNLNA